MGVKALCVLVSKVCWLPSCLCFSWMLFLSCVIDQRIVLFWTKRNKNLGKHIWAFISWIELAYVSSDIQTQVNHWHISIVFNLVGIESPWPILSLKLNMSRGRYFFSGQRHDLLFCTCRSLSIGQAHAIQVIPNPPPPPSPPPLPHPPTPTHFQ